MIEEILYKNTTRHKYIKLTKDKYLAICIFLIVFVFKGKHVKACLDISSKIHISVQNFSGEGEGVIKKSHMRERSTAQWREGSSFSQRQRQ